MKKLVLLIAALTVLYTNVNALYIWQDFDNPSFPPRGWTLGTTNAFNWENKFDAIPNTNNNKSIFFISKIMFNKIAKFK